MSLSEKVARTPGKVVLFGSGETAAGAQKAYHQLFAALGETPRVAILETPAGFELNSEWVAGQVAAYIRQHLRNFAPQVTLVPARKRGSEYSPDNPSVVAPLLTANVIYMGAGSPTYAVRQLQGSLALHYLLARHRLGADIVFASAAVIAASRYALPVYEIYKVGEDLHWKAGLDFFGPFGLELVFVPHWDNREGGAHLDTSRCFMGEERFRLLLEMLPHSATVVGIDEHTQLQVDFQRQHGYVSGRGGATVIAANQTLRFESDEAFPLTALGPFHLPEPVHAGIPVTVWEEVVRQAEYASLNTSHSPPDHVLALVKRRQEARARRDWPAADALRREIEALGWQIRDTPTGPELLPLNQ